jgi:branched-chain amino acid transport system permease protein
VTFQVALQILFNAAAPMAVYTMLAVGLTIFLGTLRVLNFAQGDFGTAGGYVIYAIVSATGLSLYAALGLGMLAGAAIGVGFYFLIYSPLRTRPPITLLLGTFGLSILLQGLIQLLFTSTPRSVKGVSGSLNIAGAYLSTPSALDMLIAVGLISVVFLLFQFTNIGRSIKAVAENPVGAVLVGIDTRAVFVFACAVGGALSAAAGLVLATTLLLTPTVGFDSIFQAFTIVILAGLGNLFRVLIVSGLLAVVQSVAGYLWTDAIGQIVTFAIIVGILVLRPSGLGSART